MPIPGSNIALLRRQMGLSLRQLAKAAEVDFSTLSRLEGGKGGYSPESIARLAKVLTVSVGVLFSEPGVVEAAALGMREVPLLTPAELMDWRSAKGIELTERERFLHVALSTVSQHAFALTVADDANFPEIKPGDQLIFDAKRQPAQGHFVVAQCTADEVCIGRYQPWPESKENEHSFVIVPDNPVFALTYSHFSPPLRLRGVLAEQRRINKATGL